MLPPSILSQTTCENAILAIYSLKACLDILEDKERSGDIIMDESMPSIKEFREALNSLKQVFMSGE